MLGRSIDGVSLLSETPLHTLIRQAWSQFIYSSISFPENFSMDSNYDVVVVGAGPQGLAAAKTYLQIEPSVRLLIVDSNRTIGGVWAEENLYSELRTNNLIGTFEYTDFPMNESFGVKKEEHIPGEVIYEYLRQYSAKFDLTRRISLETYVVSAEKIEDTWKLIVTNWNLPEIDRSRVITCSKLIVATGVTSTPAPIEIAGQGQFTKPIVDFARFRQDAPQFLEDSSTRHVAVYGGSKAAYDAVYMLASKGKRVSWIIRACGHGPTHMAPPHLYLGPFRCWLEALVVMRPFAILSPCVWGQRDGFGYLRSLIHGTSIGRWLVGKFWSKLNSDLLAVRGLEVHSELRKLIPDLPAVWYGAGFGILNYPTDIHNFVKSGQVEIFRKDIECLRENASIKFKDDSTVEVDALVCCTGWKSTSNIRFLPESIHSALGIPSGTYSSSEEEMWRWLDHHADLEIVSRFPYLAKGPMAPQQEPDLGEKPIKNPSNSDQSQSRRKEIPPWRLWRGVAPPALSSSNIVFLGVMMNFQTSLRAEISSLWAYAYLNGKLVEPLATISTIPSFHNLKRLPADPTTDADFKVFKKEDEKLGQSILYDTALFNRFSRWRYPMGYGARYPDIIFDAIPYFDLLLGDLGLKTWRKGWGWFGELFGGAYMQEDYRDLVEEWLRSYTPDGKFAHDANHA